MIGELVSCAAILLLSYAFYKWATLHNDYFERRNVKYMKPSFLIGSTGRAFSNKYDAMEYSDYLYKAFPDQP